MARAGWAGSPMHRALCIKMFFTWTFLGKQNVEVIWHLLISLADSLKFGTSEKTTTFLIDLFQIFVALSELFIFTQRFLSMNNPKTSQFQASFYRDRARVVPSLAVPAKTTQISSVLTCLKVSKSRKQFMSFSILSKNEQNSLP